MSKQTRGRLLSPTKQEVNCHRPVPSSKNPLFQNEAKGTTFLVKMRFTCMRMKNRVFPYYPVNRLSVWGKKIARTGKGKAGEEPVD